MTMIQLLRIQMRKMIRYYKLINFINESKLLNLTNLEFYSKPLLNKAITSSTLKCRLSDNLTDLEVILYCWM
jgi:hypothetical protein